MNIDEVENIVRAALEAAYTCNENNGYHNAFDIDLIIDFLSNQFEPSKQALEQKEWISTEDRLPDFIDDKDYSKNVFGICEYDNGKTYMSVFQRIYVDDSWAWAKISAFFGDIHEAECEFDDDYNIIYWQPLPAAHTARDKP